MVRVIVLKDKKKEDNNKISTGIKGLDKLLFGGIPKKSVVSLSGNSGSGKTVFGLQFLCYGASDYDESGVFISLQEEPENLVSVCEDLGFGAKKLIKEKKLIIAKIPLYKFNLLKETIREKVTLIKAKRVVIDPGAMIELFFERSVEARKALVELSAMLKSLDCTTIITNDENTLLNNMTDYSSDGIIYLSYNKEKNQFVRRLSIVKMRGSNHSDKVHSMKITEKGIEVSN